MATSRWRARDYVLTSSICFLFLVLFHQARTRSNLADLQTALEQTREVAIDLRMEQRRIDVKLEALEAAYRSVTGGTLPPLPPTPPPGSPPPPRPTLGDMPKAVAETKEPSSAVTHRTSVEGGLSCVGWRQTGGCTSDGTREPEHDHDCTTKVMAEWSGYCECEGGVRAGAVGCAHSDFTCAVACEEKPFLDREQADGATDGMLARKWAQIVGRGVANDPGQLPSVGMEEFIKPVAGLTVHDCPAGSEKFYANIPVVYTWVNGSMYEYQKLREQAGGPKAVGGARDRDNGELRFSIRSLQKFMPWWNGTIYIVAPNQTPSWIDAKHPRVKIVDQDSLFPEEDQDVLPQFNTNAIEQWLWRLPGLTAETFVHMNDDYIFTAPIEPQDLLGPSCTGIRQLLEKGKIKHRSADELKGMLERGGRTWLNSVASSVFALDKRYNSRKSEYPYLKHSPFVYSREGCRAVTEEYRAELRTTMEHKFRNGGDVIMPLLHHGYMRAEGTLKHGVDLTIAPQEEMAKYILLSLSGDEPPDPANPKKKTAAMEHAAQRASKWYGKILTGETPTKMVTLNDEMGGVQNQTVVAQFHHFALSILPECAPTDFGAFFVCMWRLLSRGCWPLRSRAGARKINILRRVSMFTMHSASDLEADCFIAAEMPLEAKDGHLEFDIEQHHPGFLEKLRNGFFSNRPRHDADDGMR